MAASANVLCNFYRFSYLFYILTFCFYKDSSGKLRILCRKPAMKVLMCLLFICIECHWYPRILYLAITNLLLSPNPHVYLKFLNYSAWFLWPVINSRTIYFRSKFHLRLIRMMSSHESRFSPCLSPNFTLLLCSRNGLIIGILVVGGLAMLFGFDNFQCSPFNLKCVSSYVQHIFSIKCEESCSSTSKYLISVAVLLIIILYSVLKAFTSLFYFLAVLSIWLLASSFRNRVGKGKPNAELVAEFKSLTKVISTYNKIYSVDSLWFLLTCICFYASSSHEIFDYTSSLERKITKCFFTGLGLLQYIMLANILKKMKSLRRILRCPEISTKMSASKLTLIYFQLDENRHVGLAAAAFIFSYSMMAQVLVISMEYFLLSVEYMGVSEQRK